jgi:SulP family sulfate permease
MQRPSFKFRPRLLDVVQGYDASQFFRDAIAGVTVGILALPLAMAFAIASGVKPEAGIFTAIIAGFLVAALGGSRVQIGGPAGAFIVIIYGIIEKYGLANLLISTMLAGVLLMAMGLFKMGNLIRFIPVPIVIGFTNGIAVLIALSQMKDFFGINIQKMPGDFFAQLETLYAHANTADWPTFLLAIISLAGIIGWTWLFRVSADEGAAPRRYQHRRIFRLLRAIPGTVLVLT